MPRRRRSSRIVRRIRSSTLLRRGAWLAGVIATLGVLGAAAVSLARPGPAGPIDARKELAQSLILLQEGNYSAARLHAQRAVDADPKWGLAHAVFARVLLSQEDGVGAESELGRAKAAGLNPARLHQLFADAWRLQGDYKRAIDEAARTAPAFRPYALRVSAKALAGRGDLPGAQRLLATLLAEQPDDSLGWSDLGRVRYQTGDAAGAIAAADHALALDGNNLEALVLRGELVRDQYGLNAALPWFASALKRDAYYVPALIDQAATFGDMGRYPEMLAATRMVLEARPGAPKALYLQAVLAARAENYDLARSLMARTNGQLYAMPGALLLNGALDYQAGAYEQAIGQWRALVGLQPMNITARRLLGAALLRSGDAKGALVVLRPVAERGDADSYSLALAGRAFEATGARDWAARLLDRAAWPVRDGSTPFGSDDSLAVLASAADADPGDPAASVGLIRGLIGAGRNDDALGRAQGLAARYPGVPQAQLLIGDTYMLLKQPDDAVPAYTRAANMRFDGPTMLRLVDALDQAGKRPQAAKVLATFLSQNPDDVPALRLAAHWQIAAGNWDQAIDTLEGLRSRIGSRDAGLLAELAYAYAGAGDTDTASGYASAAYAIAPLSPAATDAYGWVMFQAGRDGPALELLTKAAALAPGHAGIRWHLAQVLAELGRKADAKAAVTAALADPAFTDRDAAQALLKTL